MNYSLADVDMKLNEKQTECFKMLCDLVGGAHHISGKVKLCGENGIECNTLDGHYSTYDSDRLTTLVLMAHQRCIRAEISSSAPNRVKIRLHKRKLHDGGEIWDRHPTIEAAIEKFKERWGN